MAALALITANWSDRDPNEAPTFWRPFYVRCSAVNHEKWMSIYDLTTFVSRKKRCDVLFMIHEYKFIWFFRVWKSRQIKILISAVFQTRCIKNLSPFLGRYKIRARRFDNKDRSGRLWQGVDQMTDIMRSRTGRAKFITCTKARSLMRDTWHGCLLWPLLVHVVPWVF